MLQWSQGPSLNVLHTVVTKEKNALTVAVRIDILLHKSSQGTSLNVLHTVITKEKNAFTVAVRIDILLHKLKQSQEPSRNVLHTVVTKEKNAFTVAVETDILRRSNDRALLAYSVLPLAQLAWNGLLTGIIGQASANACSRHIKPSHKTKA
jgi:hypothetical protein